MNDEADFRAALPEIAEERTAKGGAPYKAYLRTLVLLCVRRAQAMGYPLAHDNGRKPKRTAFDVAAELLKRYKVGGYPVELDAHGVYKLYYGRRVVASFTCPKTGEKVTRTISGHGGVRRAEELKAASEPWPAGTTDASREVLSNRQARPKRKR